MGLAKHSQNPRFVYPECELSKLFPVRFVPLGDVTPPPASPSSSTPPENSPTTPISRRTLRTPRIVSPSEDPQPMDVSRSELTPAVKRTAARQDGPPKKKRVRVAFAQIPN